MRWLCTAICGVLELLVAVLSKSPTQFVLWGGIGGTFLTLRTVRSSPSRHCYDMFQCYSTQLQVVIHLNSYYAIVEVATCNFDGLLLEKHQNLDPYDCSCLNRR